MMKFRMSLMITLACLAPAAERASAVPSFARQTGFTCNMCHRNPPELTELGRAFKLKGYTLPSPNAEDQVGTEKDLHLSKYFPVSAMVLISNTAFQANQPGTQNNAAGFPQQASLFLAGGYASHFGGMAQITYSHASDHFGMDNTDLRYATSSKLFGADNDFGITLNNNPSVEDLWNSSPAWGFPFISTASAVSPIASPLINGGLAQDVAGVGGFNMWKDHLYTDVTVYRSEHAGASTPVSGAGAAYNIHGVAPYWRAAWQQDFHGNSLMVGTYGIYVNSYPGAVSGPTDRYADAAVDFQFSRPIGSDEFDAHGSYTREKNNLGATFAAQGAAMASHYLNSFKVDAIYHWKRRYSATGALFSTSGEADSVLYAPAALTGSNNGRPASTGYIAQFAFWPVQNINLNVNYTGYTKFNGATTNYDGANRNASDNNSVYLALWVSF
jgi:hypothetical protein